MFFLGCSSLKNRLVYLVDASSLTLSPLGRELLTLLLFSIATASRAIALLLKMAPDADGSLFWLSRELPFSGLFLVGVDVCYYFWNFFPKV